MLRGRHWPQHPTRDVLVYIHMSTPERLTFALMLSDSLKGEKQATAVHIWSTAPAGVSQYRAVPPHLIEENTTPDFGPFPTFTEASPIEKKAWTGRTFKKSSRKTPSRRTAGYTEFIYIFLVDGVNKRLIGPDQVILYIFALHKCRHRGRILPKRYAPGVAQPDRGLQRRALGNKLFNDFIFLTVARWSCSHAENT